MILQKNDKNTQTAIMGILNVLREAKTITKIRKKNWNIITIGHSFGKKILRKSRTDELLFLAWKTVRV